MKKRITLFDNTRAVCILYIICFWHLANYISQVNVQCFITNQVTYGVLGCFTFISGYFVGNSKVRLSSKNEYINYYRKRFWQLYPLFFLSAVSLLVINIVFGYDYITGGKQFVLTILGVTMFVPPAPSTIWFVSMIIFFYLITPILIFPKKILTKLLVSFSLYGLILLFDVFVNKVDNRLLMLMPVYIIGVLLSGEDIRTFLRRELIIVSFALYAVGLFICKHYNSIIIQTVLIVLGIELLLGIGFLLDKSRRVSTILQRISQGGMVAYLFHRQFFGVIKMIFPNDNQWYIFIISLPLLFVISYYFQILYEKLIKSLKYGTS